MNIHRHEDPHRRSVDRLSEYMDGSLGAEAREDVEAHLASCPGCRAVLQDLREVARTARTLGPIEPPRDLWPDIVAELRSVGDAGRPAADDPASRASGASAGEGRPGGRGWQPAGRAVGTGLASSRLAGEEAAAGGHEGPGRTRGQRRFSLTASQLAAAAILLVTISSAGTWWARSVGTPPAQTASGSASGPAPVLPAARSESVPLDAEAASELARLEALLEASRARLDPGTVDVLERNLVIIERAIEDSYRALALDPGNDFLRGHLERAFERKLDYLRDVSLIVDRAG